MRIGVATGERAAMRPGSRYDDLIAASGLPRLEARALLAALAGRRTEWLIAHGDEAAADDLAGRFAAAAGRRRAGEPLAYLTGRREFFGREFAVGPGVLIPRADTECLVELALARLADVRRTAPRVLDLGTGSGILAITIALERPDARVLATDRSAEALAIAARNAAALGAAVDFRPGDWWQALDGGSGVTGRFDLVVGNPPYIAADDPHLRQGDLRFEPAEALAAGPDGLADLERIIAGAAAWLAPGGWLLLEHGFDQGPAVRARLAAAGFADVATHPDLEGRDRVGAGRMPDAAAAAPPAAGSGTAPGHRPG